MGSMRLNRTLNTLKKREQGFTLVELIAVVAIIAMIAIYVTIEINQSTDDAKVGLATAFLASNVPGAISSYRSRHNGSCRGFDDVDVGSNEDLPELTGDTDATAMKKRLVLRGLAPTTPWDDFWSVKYEDKLVIIEYPVSGQNSKEIIEDMEFNLTDVGKVISVTGDEATGLTVTYSCS
ncbi:type II secretion system protein [Ketobacter sp.]